MADGACQPPGGHGREDYPVVGRFEGVRQCDANGNFSQNLPIDWLSKLGFYRIVRQ